MQKLNPTQKKRLEQMAALLKGGDVALLSYLMDLHEKLDTEIPQISNLIKKMKGDPGHTPTKNEIIAIMKECIRQPEDGKPGHSPTKKELVEIMRETFEQPKDGKTPNRFQLLELIDPLVPSVDEVSKKVVKEITPLIPKIEDMEKDLPKLGMAIRDGLELLNGNERLDIKAIRGLQDVLKQLNEKFEGSGAGGTRLVGGTNGIFLYVNGQKKGIIKTLDLKDGSNSTVSYSIVNGMPTVTFNSTGSGGSGIVESVVGDMSIEVDATDPANPIITLVGDSDTPGNSKYYGTDGSGNKGFHDLPGGGGSGITRDVVVTSGSFTAGSTALKDYVYLVAGAHAGAMPTAVGNSNEYTFKNNHSADITITADGSDTIEGASSITIAPEDSVTIISDNISAWSVI